MRILLVKLSSLGDVIHNLPVVTDLARAFPDATLEWAIEPPYAGIARLHPAIRRVWPVPLRQLKRQWWSAPAWRELLGGRAALRREHYDQILDTQGLAKSAMVAAWARGPIAGYDAASAREPVAARRYQQTFAVPVALHAVERNRRLAAAALGYALPGAVDYGLSPMAAAAPVWLPAGGYVVFLHATSRADKMWPEADWIALGQRVAARGPAILLPHGNAAEEATSCRLAAALPAALVPPRMTLTEAAAMLARATAVVGVDTGLAHLAVALARPTIGLYLTTEPARTGLYGGSRLANLGGGSVAAPVSPPVDGVWHQLASFLDAVP